ncbi:MAG: hypothetical protein HN757_04570 [Calditrichaeota bacterium]|nr:hypothetical protein [Calditrichota bacterium]
MVNVGRRVRDITITANPSADGWSGRNAQPTENEFSDRLLRGNDVIKDMRRCNDDTYKPRIQVSGLRNCRFRGVGWS